MSTLKVDTIRPVTTDADLALQGDASGAGVTGAKVFGDGSLGADSITDLAGSGAPDFPNGLTYNNEGFIGLDQTWQSAELTNTGANFTDGTPKYRINNTTYTNNSGKMIAVAASTSASSANNDLILTIDGITICSWFDGNDGNSTKGTVFGLVPNGSTYKITNTYGNLSTWAELR